MKLTKEEWLSAGLTILTEQGPDSLKVDVLCKYQGVTKGSFYHHFSNRLDYIQQLLAFWQQQNTQDIIAQVEHIEALPQRSAALDAITLAAETGPEKAFRAWAQTDTTVAKFVQQVDEQRIEYLQLIIAPQLPDSKGANLIAKLAYAHFIGAQQLDALISKEEWRKMNELLRGAFTKAS